MNLGVRMGGRVSVERQGNDVGRSGGGVQVMDGRRLEGTRWESGGAKFAMG